MVAVSKQKTTRASHHSPDKSKYPDNSLLISSRKHVFLLEAPWQGTSNEYPKDMYFHMRNKKNSNTFWLKKVLIWSYDHMTHNIQDTDGTPIHRYTDTLKYSFPALISF